MILLKNVKPVLIFKMFQSKYLFWFLITLVMVIKDIRSTKLMEYSNKEFLEDLGMGREVKLTYKDEVLWFYKWNNGEKCIQQTTIFPLLHMTSDTTNKEK